MGGKSTFIRQVWMFLWFGLMPLFVTYFVFHYFTLTSRIFRSYWYFSLSMHLTQHKLSWCSSMGDTEVPLNFLFHKIFNLSS
jgi:hypothetical protein